MSPVRAGAMQICAFGNRTARARCESFMLLALLPVCLLFGCDRPTAPPPPATAAPQSVQRANPASENCAAKGGKHSVERNPAGGEFGVCLFEDNRQCEEWALLRGECPTGGIHVTGYATTTARFCAISGGKYTTVARSGAANEQGSCVLPGGSACDANDYFRGTCRRGRPESHSSAEPSVTKATMMN